MPSQQAVTQLATTIAQAFNAMLPEPDPTLPEDVRRAISDSMDEVRAKNQTMSQIVAGAINTFIKQSSVTFEIPWDKLRPMLVNKLDPNIKMVYSDVLICAQQPATPRRLTSGSSIVLAQSGGVPSITITKNNAIS